MANSSVKILLIEDDKILNDDITAMLSEIAEVKQVFNGADGEYEAVEAPYDLIVSDLMLPEMNGLDIIKEMRDAHIETPVLILTAKDSVDDKVKGFEVGADDYLTKPFHREELMARVEALLRRAGIDTEEKEINIGNLKIHLSNRTVTVGNQNVQLVGKEYDILVYLAKNKNIIITKDQIFDRVWGLDSDTTTSVVNIYLNNLRRKLESVGKNDLIKTLRNVGFILESDEQN
ncbi:Transcriptional regulatory protein CiaR [Oenococcus oeni]|uniref:response regulator transcription factor n=1 Tax=Oenococcus oeni TaxID=1247 RepID=UPI00107801D5|nr:response regulator transcription factor [Oenococcus oeni]AVI93456.1 two-component system response regulator [Oenococcus oeni]SYW00806.1 Transcriptional regulatory protein CiaR [Oenococcus oeni]SYW05085.1 Transcriptional regulatory protein CiaR [Oenococcus oeni]SYW18653.1 Transcriptional regulatory protein CiaR [Oenococcus oeni]VDC13858.1 Transcriptional regulatory protein CiaR [Oenococcus oeni]